MQNSTNRLSYREDLEANQPSQPRHLTCDEYPDLNAYPPVDNIQPYVAYGNNPSGQPWANVNTYPHQWVPENYIYQDKSRRQPQDQYQTFSDPHHHHNHLLHHHPQFYLQHQYQPHLRPRSTSSAYITHQPRLPTLSHLLKLVHLIFNFNKPFLEPTGSAPILTKQTPPTVPTLFTVEHHEQARLLLEVCLNTIEAWANVILQLTVRVNFPLTFDDANNNKKAHQKILLPLHLLSNLEAIELVISHITSLNASSKERPISLLDVYTIIGHFQLQDMITTTADLRSLVFAIIREKHIKTFEVGGLYSVEVNRTVITPIISLALENYLFAGCIAYSLYDFQRSIQINEFILKLNHGYAEALFNIANAYLSLSQTENSIKYFTKTIKLRPLYFDAIEQLSSIYCTLNKYQDCIHLLETTVHYVADLLARRLRMGRIPYGSKTAEIIREINHQDMLILNSGMKDFKDLGSFLSLWQMLGNVQYELGNTRQAAKIFAGLALFTIGDVSSYAKDPSTNANSNNGGSLADDTLGVGYITDIVSNRRKGIPGLATTILHVIQRLTSMSTFEATSSLDNEVSRLLISPQEAVKMRFYLFGPQGLPGLIEQFASVVLAHRYHSTAASTTTTTNEDPKGIFELNSFEVSKILVVVSNAVLNLSKILQDGLTAAPSSDNFVYLNGMAPSPLSIFSLYTLSLSLEPNASTANNIGILLTGFEGKLAKGLGFAKAMKYYEYGLAIDAHHPHIYTNLGSLYKEQGDLPLAVKMYSLAVENSPNFDIALTNLAAGYKDLGDITKSIEFYRRALKVNARFIEALTGLVSCVGGVCYWIGRGVGFNETLVVNDEARVVELADQSGKMIGPLRAKYQTYGWLPTLIKVIQDQISEFDQWGKDALTPEFLHQIDKLSAGGLQYLSNQIKWLNLNLMPGQKFKIPSSRHGEIIIRLIENLQKYQQWRWYQDMYGAQPVALIDCNNYLGLGLPSTVSMPPTVSVLPFHTFTLPLRPKQIRRISEINAIKVSATVFSQKSEIGGPGSAATSNYLKTIAVYPPPKPPQPELVIGYISSDFVNHPLAHLMQNVFNLHGTQTDLYPVKVMVYATTPSDGSKYRQHIERTSRNFRDVSKLSTPEIIQQILQDGVHVLVNLNGFTKGSRNEIFAAKAVPVSIGLMGFAGSLGGLCDYIWADRIVIPKLPDTVGEEEDWVYTERVIYNEEGSFFCCDHKQSAPDSSELINKGESTSIPHIPLDATTQLATFEYETRVRTALRKQLFPALADDVIILANFNQLYKIDPTIFVTWLKIMERVENCILWLLRFPIEGEGNLRLITKNWVDTRKQYYLNQKNFKESDLQDKLKILAGIPARLIFTAVADKDTHITRSKVVDLFLDTPECNAHTTAADVLWNGTPIITYPRYDYKMSSRVAASLVANVVGRRQQKQQHVNCEINHIGHEHGAYKQEMTTDYKLSWGKDSECHLPCDNGNIKMRSTNEGQAVNCNTEDLEEEEEDIRCRQWVIDKLIVNGENAYEDRVVELCNANSSDAVGLPPLLELRRILYTYRTSNGNLFDTAQWVCSFEKQAWTMWDQWVAGN